MTIKIDEFKEGKPGIVILSATMTDNHLDQNDVATARIITTGVVTTVAELERAIAEYKEETANG